MTQDRFNKAPKLDQILYDTTGMLVENHPSIVEAMELYAKWYSNSSKQQDNKGLSVDNLSDNLNNSIQGYVDIFCSKHDLDYDFWIADLVGTIVCLSDEYFVDFGTIRLDLEEDIPRDKFFSWYELTLDLEMRGKPIVNYHSYVRGINCKHTD